MLQTDPGLTGTGLVIFDEFHERSLQADLALALCRDVQEGFNETLRLLVMSATLEAAPVADVLEQAPVLTCPGQTFPVETHYCGREPEDPAKAVAAAVVRAVSEDRGSVLVFLPGAAEIRQVAKRLETAAFDSRWEVAPLYGNLPFEKQKRAILPAPARRHKIVLATSIAETSLTIEGIRVVVDSGLSRVPRFDAGSGLTRLVTLPVTRSSADQRRGRAGRMAPGVCYRLWSREQHAGLVPHTRPAILDADLAPLALELARWGVRDAAVLSWIDPPPTAALVQAQDLLMRLGALDQDGRITAHGRQMAELPLHPRLAHMVLNAMPEGEGTLACNLAALLGERDIIRFDAGGYDADLDLRLDILDRINRQERHAPLSGVVDRSACRRVVQVANDLGRRLAIVPSRMRERKAGLLLAWAYPDRIAQRRPGDAGRYLLSGGRGAFLDPSQPLAASDYLVAANLDGERRNARIFLGAAIDPGDLHARMGSRMHWESRVAWDAGRQAVTAERSLKLGALILKTEPLTEVAPEAREAAFLKGIRLTGLDCLPWTKTLRTWQTRVTFLRRIRGPGDGWPDVSDARLAETLSGWLGPYLAGFSRLKDLKPEDLDGALKSLLSRPLQQRLDQLAPTHITVPSGSRRPIDYEGDKPVLAVRIQEMFGTRETPTIAGGRQPLVMHLLSPAGRPAQITQDLGGFWQNSYPAVMKELRGRYPKHYWPEDPLNAVPTSRVRPR
jgi:ATP-dependent helicase HrpB